MISFFRKIRQSLISHNKVTRYLVYAIGEIVLVMIGILLALQVNTWNEKRKLKTEEIKTLQNFRESLKDDSLNFEFSMLSVRKTVKSMELILNWINADKSYQDSLKYHFGNLNNLTTPIINTSPFESLKSNNLTLISNKDLRQKIIHFYDSNNAGMALQINHYRAIIEDASSHFYPGRFDEFWKATSIDVPIENGLSETILIGEMEPINFEDLKKDQEYLYFLKTLKNKHHYYLEINTENMFTNLKNLMNEIDKELDLLENG
ncbi:DUF6090 family protein [Algoriphagus sp.]|uniref:DUF6090 family protein n=1 Tax=Algoriphagus sp. TaxID=1872435 RepID=UPI0025DC4F95|nr:DUF6090 family protein [Algoriphagus sp.]